MRFYAHILIHEFRSVVVGWIYHQSRYQCRVMQSNDDDASIDFHVLAILKDIYRMCRVNLVKHRVVRTKSDRQTFWARITENNLILTLATKPKPRSAVLLSWLFCGYFLHCKAEGNNIPTIQHSMWLAALWSQSGPGWDAPNETMSLLG